MNRPLPPRTLRRIATLLDEEADTIGRSYGVIFGVAPPQSMREREVSPIFQAKDVAQRRRFMEMRRLARELREAAG